MIGWTRGGPGDSMGRAMLITALAALLIAIGYGLGAFAESFSLNQCYALSLQALAADADRTAASKSDAALVRFRALVRSLPLAGFKTDCRRVQAVIVTGDSSPGTVREP
jgi:hypothetical protein